MASKVIGAKTKPRALIAGFDEDTTAELGSLFPTWRAWDLEEPILDTEWDVLVARNPWGHAARHLDLIAFGEQFGYATTSDGVGWPLEVQFQGISYAQEFEVGTDLHPDLTSLIERVLLPMVRARDSNSVLSTVTQGIQDVRALSPSETWATPFLCTTEPKVLACSFTRQGDRSEAWCLPLELANDPLPWVRAALRVRHERDPERYPHDPGWPTNPRWKTQEEVRIATAIEELQEERTQYIAESKGREAALIHDLGTASSAAEAGPRLLLTGQGDPLVEAVRAALERLGFEVEDHDEALPDDAPRLEDLRVRAPSDDAEWVALVEVRGYVKGAALNDLLRLGRFEMNYVKDEGKNPSRTWYIVNQFVGQDPATRPPVLNPHPQELTTFEEDSGMVMDTAVLFELMRLVEDGTLDVAAARRHLMDTVGRCALPAS